MKNHIITSQLLKIFKSTILNQIFITIILFLLNDNKSFSQIFNDQEFSLVEKLFNEKLIVQNNYFKYKNSKEQYNSFFYYLFIFYKKYISSQDASHCVFKPSCSEYAIKVISKQGFFPGILNAIDRFSRCHSLSIENYDYDEDIQLLIDPPTNWKYEKIE